MAAFVSHQYSGQSGGYLVKFVEKEGSTGQNKMKSGKNFQFLYKPEYAKGIFFHF